MTSVSLLRNTSHSPRASVAARLQVRRKPRFSGLRSIRTPRTAREVAGRGIGRRVVEDDHLVGAWRRVRGDALQAAEGQERLAVDGDQDRHRGRRVRRGQFEGRDHRLEAERLDRLRPEPRRPDELGPQPAGQRPRTLVAQDRPREARLPARAGDADALRAQRGGAHLEPMDHRAQRRRHPPARRRLQGVDPRPRGGEHRLQPLDRALELRAFAQLARDLAPARSDLAFAGGDLALAGGDLALEVGLDDDDAAGELAPRLPLAAQDACLEELGERHRHRVGSGRSDEQVGGQFGERRDRRGRRGGDRGNVAREVVVLAHRAGRQRDRPGRAGNRGRVAQECQQRGVPLGRRRVVREQAGAGPPGEALGECAQRRRDDRQPGGDRHGQRVRPGLRHLRREQERRGRLGGEQRRNRLVVVGAGGADRNPGSGRQRSPGRADHPEGERQAPSRGVLCAADRDVLGPFPARGGRGARPSPNAERARGRARGAARYRTRARGSGGTLAPRRRAWGRSAARRRQATRRMRRARNRCRPPTAPAARRGRRCSRRRRARRSNRLPASSAPAAGRSPCSRAASSRKERRAPPAARAWRAGGRAGGGSGRGRSTASGAARTALRFRRAARSRARNRRARPAARRALLPRARGAAPRSDRREAARARRRDGARRRPSRASPSGWPGAPRRRDVRALRAARPPGVWRGTSTLEGVGGRGFARTRHSNGSSRGRASAPVPARVPRRQPSSSTSGW